MQLRTLLSNLTKLLQKLLPPGSGAEKSKLLPGIHGMIATADVKYSFDFVEYLMIKE
jgi:hypothetical protein